MGWILTAALLTSTSNWSILGAGLLLSRGRTPRSIALRRPTGDMAWIDGDEFEMGSDCHYPEEAPVHCVRKTAFLSIPFR
jgi:formylglycine-generating enzyme required for sulfatase activity